MLGTEYDRLSSLDHMYPVWEPHTLWTRFQQSAERFPLQEYIIFEDCSFTYAQVKEQVNSVARSLYALGVRPGTHIAVLLVNSPEFVFLTFALAKLGAVKVPVNAGVAKEELCHVLRQSDSSILFSKFILDEDLFSQCPELRQVVVTEQNKLYTSPNLIYWAEFCALADQVRPDTVEQVASICQDPGAISDIMFTSGSTARSKGVMLGHDMLLRSAYASCRTRRFELGRRMLILTPLFHAYAYVEGLLALLYVGGTLVMSRHRFEPHHALRLLRDFEVNDMIVLGSIMTKMLKEGQPKPEDYPHLHAAYWAVSAPDWSWDACRERFGIQDITTGSGMTETCSTCVLTRPTDPPDYVKKYDGALKDAGCAGLSEYNGHLMEFKICDPATGELLPQRAEGETYHRGITVTAGYYKDTQATRRHFTPDGWLKSGDLWRMDQNGYLTFCGRCDDMYKINGENVSPLFVDFIIGQCPQVTAVETVGVVHPELGAVGVAFIEAIQDDHETKTSIEAYCLKHLARYQLPKYYFYSDSRSWPRTGTGKISKKGLRTLAMQLLSQES